MTRPLTLIQTTGAADCLTEPNGNRRFAALPCRVTVPDHQLSLAIGKEGQNARLAAKLTGYKIDIKSDAEV